jgi:multidrug resistance efflux pump
MRELFGRKHTPMWLVVVVSAVSVGLAGCAQVTPLVKVNPSVPNTDQTTNQSQVLTTAPTPTASVAKPTAATAPGLRSTTVRLGSIADVLLLNGRVAGVDETPLAPAAHGTVDTVYVQPGQTVKAGQLLLDLDSKQQQKDLTAAQAKAAAAVDALQRGQQQVAQGQQQSNDRRDSAVADAQARLRQAQADQDKVRAGASATDRQAADTAVLLAQNGLERAVADLNKLTAGPDQSATRSAQQLVATSQVALQGALADQAKLRAGPDATAVREAERALADAKAAQLAAQTEFDKLTKGADPYDIRAAERAVQLAQANIDAAAAAAAAPVAPGASTGGATRAQRDAAETVAKLALLDAQDRLAKLKEPPSPASVQLAQSKLEDAKSGVATAQDKLDLLRKPVDQLALDKAQSAVDAAQAALDNAMASLAQLQSGPADDQVQGAKGAVEAAKATLTSAQARQAEVYSHPTDAEARDAQDKVSAAQQALDKILRGGPSTADASGPDMAALRRAVDDSNAQVADAQTALDATQLHAASQAVVAQVLVRSGDNVDSTKPAILLAQSADPVVRVNLLDGDKPKRVDVGQSVKVQLDGSDDQLDGHVASFAPAAANGDRIALVAVDWGTAHASIGTGARASITVQHKDNALLVPRRAIKTAGSRTYVEVQDGSTRKAITVEVGITTSTDAEIVSGLTAGQSILLDSAIDTAPNSGVLPKATPAPGGANGAAAASVVAAAPTIPASAPTPGTVPATGVTQAPTSTQTETAPVGGTLAAFDEHFTDNARGWTSNSQGTAWIADGMYHLVPRQAAQFVGVSIPGTENAGDIVVSGTFHKTGGPAGGGYGLILRDQDVARDGLRQNGLFYVFEVGDKGEIGLWLHDGDHWVDLVPWTPAAAVNPGTGASNELSVKAVGDELTFTVNGHKVATQTDTQLHHGAAGIFAGGDGNQVAVGRLTVATPR